MWLPVPGINRNIVECKVICRFICINSCLVLIETLWNVKFFHPYFFIFHHGINRNIVECKERRHSEMVEESRSINRNIVECKAKQLSIVMIQTLVLIETLWNVKWGSGGFGGIGGLVLIETLWNVKFQYITSCIWVPVGINRNIVECKDMLQVVCGCQCRGY